MSPKSNDTANDNNTNTDILLAGAFAALSIDLLVYPLDTIKTRVQSPDYKKLYTNQLRVNRSLFRGLYQGVGSVILATIPSSGAFFTTYEATKSTLTFLPVPVANSVASCAGELVSCVILTPAEVLKQNAQVVKRSGHVFDAGATRQAIGKFNRPSQLWRGYMALASRNLPFTAMQFPMYEHLKKTILEYRKRHDVTSGTLLERGLVTAVAAGSSGSVSALITTPVDVVKTRIMLGAGNKVRNRGALTVAKEITRVDGVRGLFKGGSLRSAWTALGMGLYLGIYESGRAYLEGRRTGEGEPLI